MSSESTQKHRAEAAESSAKAVACAVLTVSDTRTEETDTGGPLIRQLLEAAGHQIVDHAICKDEAEAIGRKLDEWIERADVQAVLTTGGTGIAKRDTTIEEVEKRLTSRLDGFGELFRMLSWKEVGAAAMMSRATGGVVVRPARRGGGGVGGGSKGGGDTFLFAMPGSLNAVRTAMVNLIVPELSHLVWERKRQG